MRWGETLTLEFVKMYLKQECLWNPDHPDYKLKHKRHDCYCIISSEFEVYSGKKMSIAEIKVKIKNLRSTYSQQVHKILQKSSPDAMYEPSLVWFREMDRCLKNVQVNIRQSIVAKYQQDHPDMDSSSQTWMEADALEENLNDDNLDPLSSQTDEEYSLDQPEPFTVKMEHTKKNKKKKIKHRTSCHFQNLNSDGQEDEFDIYGKYIASQLRKMNLHKALRLQLEIQSLVSEARISDLS